MDDLYSEMIVDNYKNPKNFFELEGHTHKAREANASCGDMIEFYAKVDGEKVTSISFQGIGCALSTASASMLSEKVKSMSINEINKLSTKDLSEMMGIEISPTRMKCVELPLKAIKKMISQKEE